MLPGVQTMRMKKWPIFLGYIKSRKHPMTFVKDKSTDAIEDIAAWVKGL